MTATLQPILVREGRRRRTASVFRWLAVGLLLTLLPLGLLAWADNAWVLTKPWRWCAFALWIVGCLTMLASAFRAFRLPGNRDLAALLDRHASLRGAYAISTAIELPAPQTDKPEEGALLARLHATAGSLASTTTLAHPNPRMWQVAAACLAVVLVVAANPLALRRLLQPSRDLPYTTLSLAGPTTGVEEHEPFAVSGIVHGRVPKTVTLQVTGGTDISLPVAAGGGYRYTFDHGVGAPVELVVHAGADGVSTPLRVVPRDPLHPVGYEIHIQPPAYAKRAEQVETRASFSMLRGSTVRYGVTFNRETPDATMRFDSGRKPLALQPDNGQPLSWTANLSKLTRTVGYHLEAAKPDGSEGTVGEPGQIVVLPDKPPTVEIPTHNEGKLKGPHNTFAMGFQATDDVGLADVRVRYQRVGDSDWKEAVIPLSAGDPLKFATDWKMPLGDFNAQPHDTVVVVVRAQDNNTLDGPGISNSEPIFIEIPEDPDASKQDGGGGGGAGESVNPLAIERQIYRETLRSSLGRKAPAVAELIRRQTDNAKNLAEMIDAKSSAPPEYLALLEEARGAALQATVELQFGVAEGNYKASLDKQAAVIDSLIKASRMEGPGEAGESGKSFSLKSNPPKGEPEKKEALEQALANLKKLEQQQQDLNQQMGEPPPDGQSPSAPNPAPAPGEDGQTPGAPGGSPGSLAARQEQASQRAGEIGRQIQGLGPSENGGDPAQAVEQMKLAEQQQARAAGALAQGSGEALPSGESASASLKRAEQLTASLLGQKLSTTTEPQTAAPGYQSLIEQYSRRLSYDR